ncbi:hypothetical protein B0J12DRAFT_701622 [Macrophomina phaseolina]|uniref:Uncharacterized protein n=1 Tax=Macrophomina phaseolina TaxID=35725 RepID=A0ABQ8G4V3_9PEZI|nr:hypothetical protein B0J12DRAFT_701622 [Macrophomina phaseolina]
MLAGDDGWARPAGRKEGRQAGRAGGARLPLRPPRELLHLPPVLSRSHSTPSTPTSARAARLCCPRRPASGLSAIPSLLLHATLESCSCAPTRALMLLTAQREEMMGRARYNIGTGCGLTAHLPHPQPHRARQVVPAARRCSEGDRVVRPASAWHGAAILVDRAITRPPESATRASHRPVQPKGAAARAAAREAAPTAPLSRSLANDAIHAHQPCTHEPPRPMTPA